MVFIPKKDLSVGYSPCPNDTFIFYALAHEKILTGNISFQEILEDVETLNRMALQNQLNITKASYHAYAYLEKNYCLLNSGSAIGKGCGPLLVAREPDSKDSLFDLRGKTIAIPGNLTTAYLLLQLFYPEVKKIVEMPFNVILNAVSLGSVDAGLIIHESRFTYRNYGLTKISDLGELWEEETSLPLPLGGIFIQRSLGRDVIKSVDEAISESVRYAFAHREETRTYIKENAQEIDDSVIDMHIALYVNEFTVNMGDTGKEAVQMLLEVASRKRIIPGLIMPIFNDY